MTPVTLESVTYFGNATATFVRSQDSVQSGNRSAYGVIAAAGMMDRPSHFYFPGPGAAAPRSWGLGRGQAADPSPHALGSLWVWGLLALPHQVHLSVPHSGAKCRFGCCHSACVVPAPVPARAAGGHEGVPTAAREEDLTTLRMSSCHHVAGALSVAAVGTCMWLLAYQASDMVCSDHSPADLSSCGLDPGDWMCLTQPLNVGSLDQNMPHLRLAPGRSRVACA